MPEEWRREFKLRPRWVEYLPLIGGIVSVIGFVMVIGLIVWLTMQAGREFGDDDTAAALGRFMKILKPWIYGMAAGLTVLSVGMILYWAGSADRRSRL